MRLGGVTIYMQEGKVRIQKSKRPNCSGNNWKRTKAREENSAHFAAMRRVADYLSKVYDGLPIWQSAEGQPKRRAVNYLMGVMGPYFDNKGHVSQFEGLPLSQGTLVPPSEMDYEYVDGKVVLRWNPGKEGFGVHFTDRLVVMYVRESKPGHVGRVKEITATRGDGEASFALRLTPGDKVHVYPFFAAADLSNFSRNAHVCVDMGTMEMDMRVKKDTKKEFAELYKIQPICWEAIAMKPKSERPFAHVTYKNSRMRWKQGKLDGAVRCNLMMGKKMRNIACGIEAW